MGAIKFNPDTDVGDLSGKVIFVTGGTAGLGLESIVALVKHRPEHIYFTGRNSDRAAALITQIKATAPDANVTFIECDLASLESVKIAAQKFTASRLLILMCNAGIGALPPGLTKNGYELHFGTNHLGHALLIKLLLPTMLQTAEDPNADVRIVLLSSLGFNAHPPGGIIFKDLRTPQDFGFMGSWMRYGQSKLANLLYAAELARRYPNITAVSIHPGLVGTDMFNNVSFVKKVFVYVMSWGGLMTPAEGVYNQVWAATCSKDDIVNGEFYEPVGALGKHAKESKNEKLAGELWDWTQRELEGY